MSCPGETNVQYSFFLCVCVTVPVLITLINMYCHYPIVERPLFSRFHNVLPFPLLLGEFFVGLVGWVIE